MECAAISYLLGRGRIPFRRYTELALYYTFDYSKISVPPLQHCHLLVSWDTLVLWPKARYVVAEIRGRGYKTAIFSNGDSDMLHVLAKPLGENMQHILSAEMVDAYKLHPEVYNLPEQNFLIMEADVLHVAGRRNDVIGVGSFAIDC